jgi:hypothetical protein
VNKGRYQLFHVSVEGNEMIAKDDSGVACEQLVLFGRMFRRWASEGNECESMVESLSRYKSAMRVVWCFRIRSGWV